MFYRILPPLGLLPKNCKYGNKKFDFDYLQLYTPYIDWSVSWLVRQFIPVHLYHYVNIRLGHLQ